MCNVSLEQSVTKVGHLLDTARLTSGTKLPERRGIEFTMRQRRECVSQQQQVDQQQGLVARWMSV